MKTKKSFELTGAVTGLANAIAAIFTPDEIALIASIFVQLGDTLATILAQESFLGKALENEAD